MQRLFYCFFNWLVKSNTEYIYFFAEGNKLFQQAFSIHIITYSFKYFFKIFKSSIPLIGFAMYALILASIIFSISSFNVYAV